MPYMKPLYWKWMWSIISKAGERRIDSAAACAERLEASGVVFMYLQPAIRTVHATDQLGEQTVGVRKQATAPSRSPTAAGSRPSGCSSTPDCPPRACAGQRSARYGSSTTRTLRRTAGSRASTLMFSRQRIKTRHSAPDRPRAYLEVPLLHGQRVGYGQPIPVDLEVCGFAGDRLVPSAQALFFGGGGEY